MNDVLGCTQPPTTMHDVSMLLGAANTMPQRPFALLHRPESHGADRIDVLLGELGTVRHLDNVPLAKPEDRRPVEIADSSDTRVDDTLVVMPYRQIEERGFACHNDGEPVVVLRIHERAILTRAAAMCALPAAPAVLHGGHFEPDDNEYSRQVSRILENEIAQGAGSNFVIHRSFNARLHDDPRRCALSLFRALLTGETGAYWTFLVHTGERTIVGATPERHISLVGGRLTMTPISGTLSHPSGRPTSAEVRRFLADQKEADELHMVVDEELKVMSRLCAPGVRLTGPRLRPMGRVTHTEYQIEGSCTAGIYDVMCDSMFAPTVTGSPIENATRVIARYESAGRGYYSGAVAVIGRDSADRTEYDSAITIRTADILRDGQLRIGVGATLVRASNPSDEVLETRAKASGLMAALEGLSGQSSTAVAPATNANVGESVSIAHTLAQRRNSLSQYWVCGYNDAGVATRKVSSGTRALIVDADDIFTSMLDHMLRSHGLDTRRGDYTQATISDLKWPDLVVLGPGPGDPRDREDPKIAKLTALVGDLLVDEIPFLAVCLSHQVLCEVIGLSLSQLKEPKQGTQQEIDFFGQRGPVGFYNSFVAHSHYDQLQPSVTSGPVDVCRDPRTGHVHGLRGPHFASVQFHPESVLTRDGYTLVGKLLAWATKPGSSASGRPIATATHDWSQGA